MAVDYSTSLSGVYPPSDPDPDKEINALIEWLNTFIDDYNSPDTVIRTVYREHLEELKDLDKNAHNRFLHTLFQHHSKDLILSPDNHKHPWLTCNRSDCPPDGFLSPCMHDPTLCLYQGTPEQITKAEALGRDLYENESDTDVLYAPIGRSFFSGVKSRVSGVYGELEYYAELPGDGESGDLCGDLKYYEKCGNHQDFDGICKKKARPIHHHCDNWDCPVCYLTKVVTRRARDIDLRFGSLTELYRKANIKLGKIKHVSFSVDPKLWTEEKVLSDRGKKLHAEFLNVLRGSAKDGFYGGYWFKHLWRKKHRDGSECELKKCDKVHVWIWGPHYHYVGYGFFDKSDEVYNRSGWTYVRIKDKRSRNFYATVFYLLTHVGLIYRDADLYDDLNKQFVPGERKKYIQGKCYNGLGLFANCKGGRDIIDVIESVKRCDECGMGMVYVDDYGEMLGEVMEKEVVIEWHINRKKIKLKQ